MSEQAKNTSLKANFWSLIGVAGSLACISAPIIASYQGLIWLLAGIVPPLNLHSIIGEFPPPTSWIGINKIIEWVCDQPLAGTALVGGILLLLAGIHGHESALERERQNNFAPRWRR
ncbi:MAG TPA: hypothetical protein VHX18_10035 [Rhizomicrobium sp.]|nr:hypothetical protein [Rhizomicrobium sp.]